MAYHGLSTPMLLTSSPLTSPAVATVFTFPGAFDPPYRAPAALPARISVPGDISSTSHAPKPICFWGQKERKTYIYVEWFWGGGHP